jgi:Flp pilus assembly protein TadD
MVLPVKAVHQPVQGLGEQVMDPNGSFKDRDACMEYGAAALERGDCAGAEKAFLEALAFAPKDAAVMNALGMVSQRKRDFDSAIRWHRAAIAQQPGNDEMYYNLGDIYLERGDMETAMLYQKKAIQLNPGFQRRTRVYN